MSYKEMGYKLNETSIQIWKEQRTLSINNINVNTSLYDGSCDFISKEKCKEELNKITPNNEYEKIWDKFDYQAIQNACEKITLKNEDEFSIIIKDCEQFEKEIKKLGIYKIYLKEKELLDKKRKLLESDNLTSVKFRSYESWETGICFLILNERVEKNIFNKLVKSGLYYHEKIDEDNEERFIGWCLRDNEMTRLNLAENGIKVQNN